MKPTHKYCNGCKETKEVRQFYKGGKYLMSQCMDCIRDRYRTRYQMVVRPKKIEAKRFETSGLHGVSA